MKFENFDTNDLAPLYHHYSRQTSAQPAYIEIDCKNESVHASFDGDIGNAVPFSVYHGHDRRYDIPSSITGKSLASLFADEDFRGLCQRIVDGYESIWGGNNLVARLSDDAKEAEAELELFLKDFISDSDCSEVWDVCDYLSDVSIYDDLWRVNETLEQAVNRLEVEAAENKQILYGDIEDAIIWKCISPRVDTSKLFLERPDIAAELELRGNIQQDEDGDWEIIKE